MKPITLLAPMLLAITPLSQAAESPPAERLSFNDGWRFQKNDPDGATAILDYFNGAGVREAVIASSNPAGLSAEQRKLGDAVAFTRPGFDDKAWQALSLPHDWAIEGPFDQKLPGDTGKLPWVGIGWYRKTFKLPASDAGRRIYLDLDGAMAYSMVWCNGVFVGGWPYGYSSFRLDLTSVAKPGGDNVVSIRLSNPEKSSRWYPGSGIYRNVWLVKNDPVHIAHWGVTITTPEVSEEKARVTLKINVENHSAADAKTGIKAEVFRLDAKGGKSGDAVFSVSADDGVIKAGQQESFAPSLLINHPRLWSVESPDLYTAVVSVTANGRLVDRTETPFGIRTIRFTPDNGFLLNGKRVDLRGVCNHHDLGALGTAFNTRAAERQLEIMKEMGCNALRTSHNMPAPELLDLCDRMGILVMDESFDCWKKGKKANDYNKLWNDWHEKDLRAEYHRDRNHPSIIFWSIGNEVGELRDAVNGPAIAAELTRIAGEEDPTRPSVLGSNAGDACYNGIQKNVGVMGQNYQNGGYGKFREKNPDIPLVGSETSSCVSSRGEYFYQTPEQAAGKGKPASPFNPVAENKGQGRSDFQVSSYDLYAPGWACPPDNEFRAQEQNRHVAGEFVWTGFDYLGEPTPYNGDVTNMLNFHDAAGKAEMERQLKELGKIPVPSRSSYFGIVDLAGFRKDRFYLYQAHWRPELPMAHILPHWNWPERVGQVTPVHVYTSGDEAELFLNGKSLGRRQKAQYEYRLRWNDVVYQPGELKVVAYKNGKPWAQDVMKTTGPAAKLLLQADRPDIRADGLDLSFVTVTVADQNGLMVPRSKNLIRFEVSGPGEIAAVDNGDATSFEPFRANQRKAYNGLALAIIRARPGEPGNIILKAAGDGLKGAQIEIRSTPTP